MLGAVGFSTKSVSVKLAYAESAQVDAITLLTLRMLIALPFFLAVALWEGGSQDRPRQRKDSLGLLLLGFVGYYLASLLDFMGLQHIAAGLGRLILFLYPTYLLLGEKQGPVQILGSAMVLGGVALVSIAGRVDKHVEGSR